MYRKARELTGDPETYGVGVSVGLLLQDRAAEALQEAKKSKDEASRELMLAYISHSLGRRTESDKALSLVKAKYGDKYAFYIAGAHAWRGEKDLAFEWLDWAYEARDPYLCDFIRAWEMKPLKGDPRYDAFRRKLGFPE